MDEKETPMITIPLYNLRVLEITLMQFMIQRMKESDGYVEFQMPVESFNKWVNWVDENKMRIIVTIDENQNIHCSIHSLIPELEKGETNVPE